MATGKAQKGLRYAEREAGTAYNATGLRYAVGEAEQVYTDTGLSSAVGEGQKIYKEFAVADGITNVQTLWKYVDTKDAMKLNPFQVYPRSCWLLSVPTTIILVAGVLWAVAFAIMGNMTLLTQPTVTEKTTSTSPPLPYIYVCPNRAPYTLSGPVYVGCADDVSSTSLPLTQNTNGGSTRAGPQCQLMNVVTIKIMDRITKGPVDTQCVVFQHVTQNLDVPWNTQLYLMMPSANFVNGYSNSALEVLPIGMNAYLSVFGPGGGKFDLAANDNYLRDFSALNSTNNPLAKYEEGAVFLPTSTMSTFQVQKEKRVYQVKTPMSLAKLPQFWTGTTPVIQFTEVGSSTNAPLPNLVPGLMNLHNLPGDGDDFRAVAASLSISFDEHSFKESNQIGYILLVAGTIPVYLGLAARIWAWIFAPFPKPSKPGTPPPNQYFLGWARKAPKEKKEEEKKEEDLYPSNGEAPRDQFMSKV